MKLPVQVFLPQALILGGLVCGSLIQVRCLQGPIWLGMTWLPLICAWIQAIIQISIYLELLSFEWRCANSCKFVGLICIPVTHGSVVEHEEQICYAKSQPGSLPCLGATDRKNVFSHWLLTSANKHLLYWKSNWAGDG